MHSMRYYMYILAMHSMRYYMCILAMQKLLELWPHCSLIMWELIVLTRKTYYYIIFVRNRLMVGLINRSGVCGAEL